MNFYRLKSIFFIIFSCFILQTAAFAQNNVKITIKKKNITLQEALREVEKQSDYLIAFNESKLEKTKRVNLILMLNLWIRHWLLSCPERGFPTKSKTNIS